MTYQAAPNNSRYLPLTQQGWCCVPTSIQMVMYRRGIPLIPAEEIGYHLGLTVPPDQAKLFYKVRTAIEPPVSSGYGTQIQTPDYEPDTAFANLGIPLHFSQTFISAIASTEDLVKALQNIEQQDTDALLCFNPTVLTGEYKPQMGHVVVFDRALDGKVRIVDPSSIHAKWRLLEPHVLYDAMLRHGDENGGGIWRLTYTPLVQ